MPREYCRASDSGEIWSLQSECLLRGSWGTVVEVCLRFLQLSESAAEETIERDVRMQVSLDQVRSSPARVEIRFPPLEGTLTLAAAEAQPGLFKLTSTVENQCDHGDNENLEVALFRSLLSTHMLLQATDGQFLSLLDPPECCRDVAAGCQNVGLWPVLIGQAEGELMLAAPIVLYDYPRLAPESPGDLFDGTEIDELLSLRIQTLTPAEKIAMSAAGSRARAVLERTDFLTADQLLSLHGRLQRGTAATPGFQPGDRVRLRPRKTADALDLLFSGQAATIVSVERDFEGGVHLAVVLDEDPGRDFGAQGLPGHRFFYHPDEVERL